MPQEQQSLSKARQLSPVLLARLGYLMDPGTLESFITACEIARDAGSGYATVEIQFAHNEIRTIQGTFSVKPKCEKPE